jgi:hypothetical protein
MIPPSGNPISTYLLEFATTEKAIDIMLGSSSPANRMICIEFDTSATIFLIKELQTVVIDEHVGRSTLKLIGGDGLLD